MVHELTPTACKIEEALSYRFPEEKNRVFYKRINSNFLSYQWIFGSINLTGILAQCTQIKSIVNDSTASNEFVYHRVITYKSVNLGTRRYMAEYGISKTECAGR